MKVTFYKAPNGAQEVLNITKIHPEDEQFFTESGVVISMEDIGGDFVVYADTGVINEEGEPEEFIEIAQGRSCEDVLKALRVSCEVFFSGLP